MTKIDTPRFRSRVLSPVFISVFSLFATVVFAAGPGDSLSLLLSGGPDTPGLREPRDTAYAGTGGIRGLVTTSNHEPATGVSVIITENGRGTTTDEFGRFEFRKVQPGTYTLEVSLTGYEPFKKTVAVNEGRPERISIALNVSTKELDAVVVKANKNPLMPKHPSLSLRLGEPLIEAPQNVQVVSGKAISDQQIITMSDGILRNVSGTTRMEHWADLYTNVNARGSQVTALRNGMNVATSYWSPLSEDMSITDHIEFVKGPAGFLMSLGNPSGVYNVVTKKPTGQTRGEVSLTTGSFDLYRGTLDLDGKLDKEGKLLYRLNVAGKTANSFRDFEYNNRFVLAPVITYNVDESTSITAEYNLNRAKMSDLGSYYVFSTQGYAVFPRNFTTADPGLEPTRISDQSFTVTLQHRFDENWKLTAQAAYLNYTQTGASLWPSYVGADSMIRNVGVWDAKAQGTFAQAFVNGNFTTGAVQHRVLIGLDAVSKQYWADWNQSHNLDTDSAKFSMLNPVYGSPPNGYAHFDHSTPIEQRAGIYGTQKQTYGGIYVQDELGFFDNKFRLTVAGRYTYVVNDDYGTQETASHATPRIGLSWSVDKNTSVYALRDQAFLPQSGIRRDGKSIQPLTGNNYEIGVKRDWAGGKWNSSIAVYRITVNNGLSTDPSDPSGRFVLQVGQSVSKGVEFDIKGEIARGFTVTANYAYTDAEVTKADTSTASQATIGHKLPGYATHVANAWLSYAIQRGVLRGLGVSGGFTYMADRQTWEWGATSAYKQLPNYTKIDGGFFWERDRLRLSLNLYNLANAYLYSGAGYANYYYWQAEAPRNWRFGIAYRF